METRLERTHHHEHYRQQTPMPQSLMEALRHWCLGVELVGFEPTSKQGNHTLSTRLFQPLVFVRRQDLDHQPAP